MNSAVVLAPGPSMIEKGTKRKTSESGKNEVMSMADRLKLLSHDQNQKSTPPRTDSVLQLLLQGLHNKDRKILESVLDRADDDLINNTVRRLPFEAVVPLVEELQHYIQVIKTIFSQVQCPKRLSASVIHGHGSTFFFFGGGSGKNRRHHFLCTIFFKK
jgi:hypothetical protein